MDKAFFQCWFRGFEDGLEVMDAEARNSLLACCAKRCADTGVLRAHLHHYEAVGGDRDAFYRRLSEIGCVRGEVIIPGREYIVCFPDCACDLHTECGVNTPLLCECSRQSVRYVAESVWKGCRVRVEKEGTVLSGAPECRFRLVFQQNNITTSTPGGTMNKSTYETPLNSRYASPEMQYIFSPDRKFTTWRRLWVALAESEMELGLPVTQAQVDELKAHIDDIDYDAARKHEERVRHDVMAHVHAYGDVCPNARGIIHLGATSCYVTDNADILMLRDALLLIRKKLVEVLRRLRKFAWEYKDLPTLGYTHLQPAQLTTVGKRATLWMQDLTMDLEEVNFVLSTLKLLGNRGATGTQVSFMELFDGDGAKVDELEKRIAEKMGMTAVFDVSGQTYPRKLDTRVLGALSGIAQSSYKFAQDLRLLQSFREVEEPFEKNQIGSSAMAYKRNPMRSERMCALSRHVMVLTQDAAMTAATQWFERTLDDSANRRLSLPEAFLACDAVLELYANIADGMVVYPKMIEKRVMENLPFMATEDIIMESVKHGADRQEIHERVRVHSQAAANRMKAEGLEGDLMARIAADPAFPLDGDSLTALLAPEKYTGRAAEQTERFLTHTVDPILAGYEGMDMGRISI